MLLLEVKQILKGVKRMSKKPVNALKALGFELKTNDWNFIKSRRLEIYHQRRTNQTFLRVGLHKKDGVFRWLEKELIKEDIDFIRLDQTEKSYRLALETKIELGYITVGGADAYLVDVVRNTLEKKK